MNHVLAQLHKLPIPKTGFESLVYTYTHSLVAIGLAIISLIILGIYLTLKLTGKHATSRKIKDFGIIIVLVNGLLITANISIYTHPTVSYADCNSRAISHALMISNSEVLHSENPNAKFANTDTNMALIYTPSGNPNRSLTIAHFNRQTFHPINKQGRQYVKLMNTFEAITHDKHHSLVAINDDQYNNLRMRFEYQDTFYKLNFDNQSNQMRIKIL